MMRKIAYPAFIALVAQPALASINFGLIFTDQALSDYTAQEQGYFQDGLDFWSGYITGYRDGVTRDWILNVDSFNTAASGGLVTLGSAGPSNLILSNAVPGSGLSAPWADQFILSEGGAANFNTHPDAGALNPIVIRHEIGHTLGIGTLWEDNEVYSDGVADNSNRTLAGGTAGQYVGAAGLSAFQVEYGQPGATFIPIERDGGAGTANGHWNEVADNPGTENVVGLDSDPGDDVPAPIVTSGDNAGESMDNELMTGLLSGSGFLSATTIASLYDIGFTVVPEVRNFSLFVGLAVGGVLLIRRRRI